MALPLAPLAGIALRYGAVALAGYAFSRKFQRGHIDQRGEDALDGVPEGLTAQRPRDRDQMNITARLRRIVRLRKTGPGLEIDASVLARLRMKRL
jgi:hypothetical protein